MSVPTTDRRPLQARLPRRRRRRSPRRGLTITRRGWVVFTVLPLLAASAVVWPQLATPLVTMTGIEEGAVFGPRTAPSEISLTFDRRVRQVTGSLDGMDLQVEVAGSSATASIGNLADGDHQLVIEVDRGPLAPAARLERSFTIDATPPSMEVIDPVGPVPPTEPMTLRLRTDDASAIATIAGVEIAIDNDGYLTRQFERPPDKPVTVRITDRVGNVSEQDLELVLALPGVEGGSPIRGVHASGYTWSSPALKGPIMEMISAGLINTVEIDLKDEAGEVWYETGVGLAHEIGAVNTQWDLGAVVEELHGLGVRVIGRLVVFVDPKLADYAAANGLMDWVVQSPDGGAFGQYGGFTNPFSHEVWEYNIAIAEEAAQLGVDDILYDYVRRPDQFLETMRFPGQTDQTPEDVIVEFLEESLPRIHAAGARLGASVFGIAATRPHEVAQDIPRMAATVDYVAPMTYPSHWGPGEYGVANPNASPYDITFRALEDFQAQVAGTEAKVVAWLQDFSLGIEYGPTEVRNQIEAAADAGVLDFLLWDAAATYTRAALED